MKPRLIAALLLCLSAAPAWSAEIPLQGISDYLNRMTSASAPFEQFNDDGTTSSGDFFIKRPGRLRFEYNPPDEAIVVAGGGTVVVHDPKSDQTAETYPLRRTPLSLILDRNVDLGRANMVVGHVFDGTYTIVRAQDPEHPEYGSIDMMFTDNPVTLRQWVVNDSAGNRTTVVLGTLETRKTLSDVLFNPNSVGERAGR